MTMEEAFTKPLSSADQYLASLAEPAAPLLSHENQAQEATRFHKYIKPLAAACASLAMAGCSSISLGAAGSEKSPAAYSTSQRTGPTPEAPTPAPTIAEGPSQENPLFATRPTWSQNFASINNNQLNTKNWNIYLGAAPANNEAEFYTASPNNLRIENGYLNLEARKEQINSNYNYTSARLNTAGKEDFLYGKLAVTAELPLGSGTWPAIWLYPVGNKYADMSPAGDPLRYVNGGEIDIAESIGTEPNVVYGIVHTLSSALNNPSGEGYFNKTRVPGSDTRFNTYGVEWTPNKITLSINNKTYFTYKKPTGADYKSWPFDQRFGLILNVALGGVWGNRNKAKFPPDGIDTKALPASMKIKSIYYYPYVGEVPGKG